MSDEFHGYSAAKVIDDQIQNIYLKYEIKPHNVKEWLNFTRTVSTTIDTLRTQALKVWAEEKGKEHGKETSGQRKN